MGKTILNGQVVDTTSPGTIYTSVDIPDEVADFADLVTDLAAKVDEPGSPVTFTQTYSTADSTIAALTSAAVTPTATTPAQSAAAVATDAAALTAYGYTEAQANALITSHNQLRTDLIASNAKIDALITDVAAVIADNTALRADALADKKNLNRVIDILQTASLAA